MRDQFLNEELFYTLKEAQILTERWRFPYNTVRPHRSLGGQPPAPQTLQLASRGLTLEVVQKLPASQIDVPPANWTNQNWNFWLPAALYRGGHVMKNSPFSEERIATAL
jgi:transposase InsO family protein